MNMDALAGMSMDQLGELSAEEIEKLGLDGGKEDVDGASSGADATGEVEGSEDQNGDFIETKSGRGKIPFKVLEETRAEVANLKEELAKVREQGGRGTIYQAELTPEHRAQLTAVEGELSGLRQQFENGDVEWEEYQQKLTDAIGRRDILNRQVLKSEISAEISQQSAEQEWKDTVDSFLTKERDGVDYTKDEAKRNDLDMFIKVLGQDPGNSDKDYNWFLSTAHVAVMAKHGAAANVGGQQQQQRQSGNGDAGNQQRKPAFNSLSDIPGGSAPAKNEMEQLGEMSTASIANKFLNDPAAIDKYLAQLG
jgi:hypothetical protein